MDHVRFPDLAWSFAEPPYDSGESLSQAIHEYQQAIGAPPWHPAEIISTSPLYVYVSHKDTGEATDRVIAVRGAESGLIRALDLLFALHRELAELLRHRRYHFFEGLTRGSEGEYWLLLGS